MKLHSFVVEPGSKEKNIVTVFDFIVDSLLLSPITHAELIDGLLLTILNNTSLIDILAEKGHQERHTNTQYPVRSQARSSRMI